MTWLAVVLALLVWSVLAFSLAPAMGRHLALQQRPAAQRRTFARPTTSGRLAA